MSERLTLWMVEAYNSKHGELKPVYARDEQHAREQAREWLEEHKASFPEQAVYAYPGGYRVGGWTWLPGQLEGEAEPEQTGP